MIVECTVIEIIFLLCALCRINILLLNHKINFSASHVGIILTTQEHAMQCTYVCMYAHTHTRTNMHTLTHARTHINIRTHKYAHAHRYTHRYTHTHIHKHTHTLKMYVSTLTCCAIVLVRGNLLAISLKP